MLSTMRQHLCHYQNEGGTSTPEYGGEQLGCPTEDGKVHRSRPLPHDRPCQMADSIEAFIYLLDDGSLGHGTRKVESTRIRMRPPGFSQPLEYP